MHEHISTLIDTGKEKEAAKNHIGLMMQECSVMGTNDSELPALQKLLARLDKNEVSPEEAMAHATSIRYSKQEYR